MKSFTKYLVLGLAFGLRMINLNSRPLWYDEVFAVLFAEKGFSAMLYGTLTQVQGAAADVHPIVYYTGLSWWMQVVGQSPLAVRMLSVFFGTITVAVAYALAKELFGNRTAVIATLLLALSPFHVYYSQEARMYAPLALGCALVILFFVKATCSESRSIHYWVALACAAAFAMYMQNLAAFFLLAFGLSTLPKPKMFLKVALAGVGAFVLWLPWFVNVTSQFAKLQQAYWVTRPTPITLLQTLLIYQAGEELVATAKVWVALPLFVGVMVWVLLIWRLIVERRYSVPLRNRPGSALWLTVLALGTPLLLFLASLYQPVYIQRALLPAAVMFVLAMAWLLAESQTPKVIRWGLGLLIGLTFVAGLAAHYTFASFPRPQFPAAISYLKQNLAPGEVVVHSNKLTYLPMYYYDRTLSQNFVADPPGSGSDTLALPTQQVLGLFAIDEVRTASGGAKRVWFVVFDRALEEFEPKTHPHLEWLQVNYVLSQVKTIDEMTIYEFVAPK